MVPDGGRNQERLCWRGPTAIYCHALFQAPKVLITLCEESHATKLWAVHISGLREGDSISAGNGHA
jgi:hypothetical protein